MRTLGGLAGRFLALHYGDRPLLQPNAFDIGSARLLAWLGFEAIATTSSGLAATLGRQDGSVTRDEALAHAAQLAGAVEVPVAADTENGYADEPSGVAETVRLACRTGLAGCSIEDFSRANATFYDLRLATDRVAAAAEAAHCGPVQLVLTARAENYIHERPDLADTITRLQAYQEAGADVLFAPGLRSLEDIASVVSSLDRPVNVLALAGCPTVDELRSVGVARVSVGGAFAYAALAGLMDAALEFRDDGTYGYWAQAAKARTEADRVFSEGLHR
jgi:2-methylisocitrate lyase-like PEP mutase family enzyme